MRHLLCFPVTVRKDEREWDNISTRAEVKLTRRYGKRKNWHSESPGNLEKPESGGISYQGEQTKARATQREIEMFKDSFKNNPCQSPCHLLCLTLSLVTWKPAGQSPVGVEHFSCHYLFFDGEGPKWFLPDLTPRICGKPIFILNSVKCAHRNLETHF